MSGTPPDPESGFTEPESSPVTSPPGSFFGEDTFDGDLGLLTDLQTAAPPPSPDHPLDYSDVDLDLSLPFLFDVSGSSPSDTASSSSSSTITMPDTDDKISASQINSISTYTGVMGAEAELFVDSVNRSRHVFSWSDQDTARAAQQKLSGTASSWLKHQARLGTVYAAWDGDAGLQQALLKRFLTGRTLAASVGGLAELQQGQRSNESVSEFVERLSAALDKKNFETSAAEKAQQAYITSFRAELTKYLLHGLRDEFKVRVIGVPNAPEELQDIIDICTRAEEEKASIAIVHNISSGSSINKVHNMPSKPQARQRGACFTCGSTQHWADRCPQRRRSQGQARPARGGRGNPSQGNSGRSGGWTNPSRQSGPTNATPDMTNRRFPRQTPFPAYKVNQVIDGSDPPQREEETEISYAGNGGEERV